MPSRNSRLGPRKDWQGNTIGPYRFDYWSLVRKWGRGSPAVKALVRQAQRKAAKQRRKRS